MDREPIVEAEAKRTRAPLRGGSSVASVGFAVMAILLISVGASAWWAARTQSDSLERGRAEQVQLVGNVLAQGAEVMLADNEVSATRRIVAQAAQDHALTRCRVVLPDGQVVADAMPSRITLRDLPPTWEGSPLAAETRISKTGEVTQTIPLTIPGRGSATLEVAGGATGATGSHWATQAGFGAIGAGALLGLLVLHRWMSSRLQSLSAIRQALLDHQAGQTCPTSLQVDPDFGPEARAWNDLVRQQERRQQHVAVEKTVEALQGRRGSGQDLAAACDALSQGLILVDENLRARYANGAAAALLQVKRDGLTSGDISGHLRDPRIVEAVRSATHGPTHRRAIVEVERPEEHGGGVLRFIVRPVRREDSGIAMIIIEDITQQRVATEARNAFVAQATHELRTPLTNIRLYAETALDEGQRDSGVRANCLNVINQEARRLERMVGDILSVSEIEAGTLKVRMDDVRLDELFGDLQADYAAQAKDKQIDLAFNLPPKLPVMQGDRDKILLGLHNLIGNALKYTPAGGRVSVTVAAEPGRLVAEVADTGIGISPEDCQRIFERFYRARDRRVTETTGSGLGLAIAREVIRLHGGDITVQSELDKGSTFTLVLPLPWETA